MRSSLRLGLSALVLAAAPIAGHAQSTPGCPSGFTEAPLPGGGFSCTPIASSAPEIGATSSVAGIAVLFGGVMMLRGRKRLTGANLTA